MKYLDITQNILKENKTTKQNRQTHLNLYIHLTFSIDKLRKRDDIVIGE
jgi:hypothetical protein